LWRLKGTKFIFDQHDLNPELYLSRFGQPTTLGGKLQLRGLRWLERMTYRSADRVISTNESYRKLAITRGGKPADHVTVVRSGPDTRAMRPVYPPESIRRGADHLLVYLGIMGPQDGVDTILHVADELIHRRGRTGLRVALLGFGDCLEDLKRQCTEMRLDEHVVFTGRADKAMIADYLSAADVGLCPDLKTPLNDVSTMNKTMEYMAYALPSVSFDLVETRVSGADTVTYVDSGDTMAFADAVEELLEHPELRADRGTAARERVSQTLDWRPQAESYIGVFDGLTRRPSVAPTQAQLTVPVPPNGRDFVDLDDVDEIRRFIKERSRPRVNEAVEPVPTTSVA
ncbi:MAG TPA: glycosyltransferase family 4 protein, partial [Mycobacterium sp.]